MMGVDPNATLNLHDPAMAQKLVQAMSLRESGTTLKPDVAQRGVSMALGLPVPPTPPPAAPPAPMLTPPTAAQRWGSHTVNNTAHHDNSSSTTINGPININVPSGDPRVIGHGIREALAQKAAYLPAQRGLA